jgi:uncharacterized peroxidase-related enzyme
VTSDEPLVTAIVADWRRAAITERERVMLEYAETVTKNATLVSRETLDGLRAQGFDDTGILQITVIASWFNYINRMADALGVGREP